MRHHLAAAQLGGSAGLPYAALPLNFTAFAALASRLVLLAAMATFVQVSAVSADKFFIIIAAVVSFLSQCLFLNHETANRHLAIFI